MAPWLTADDFIDYFSLPESFDPDARLNQHVEDIVDDWLEDLMGVKRLKEHREYLVSLAGQNPVPDEAKDELQKRVRKFLLNAAWAKYVLHNNVMPTETGLVTKTTDYSEAISDKQRSELYVEYSSRAKRAALKVVKALPAEACTPTALARATRPSIKKAKPKKTSYF